MRKSAYLLPASVLFLTCALTTAAAQEAYVVDDPLFAYQYYLHAANIESAWDITAGDSSVVVAVLDEGMTPHREIPPSRVLEGWDYWDGDNTPAPFGNDSHGVASAGIIAAAHNGQGIAGIAPNVKILPIRVFERNELRGSTVSSRMQSIADAIDFAWQNGADVISIGWGLTEYAGDPGHPDYESIAEAIVRAETFGRGGLGTVLVAAVGNHGAFRTFAAYPASDPHVLSVGAVDRDNVPWNYSVSTLALDVVAQSGQISSGPDLIIGGCPKESTDFFSVDLRGDVWTLEEDRNIDDWEVGWNPGSSGVCEHGYFEYTWTMDGRAEPDPMPGYSAHFGGTSAAAPQVAGVAALMISVNSQLKAPEVRDIIRSTAKDLGTPGCDASTGCGLLDGGEAVAMATSVATSTFRPVPGIARFSMDVFPNPASTEIRLRFTERPMDAEIAVTDLLGRRVASYSSPLPLSIQVGDWPAGTYFYRVSVAGNVADQGTLIISR